jgi:hypothetical protein
MDRFLLATEQHLLDIVITQTDDELVMQNPLLATDPLRCRIYASTGEEDVN